jgi:hypothetical protein
MNITSELRQKMDIVRPGFRAFLSDEGNYKKHLTFIIVQCTPFILFFLGFILVNSKSDIMKSL